jgi:hypothetical protein
MDDENFVKGSKRAVLLLQAAAGLLAIWWYLHLIF